MELNKTYHGNALNVLKGFEDESINCCITSPPYFGLRSYLSEPQIWDGKENCKHKWIDNTYVRNNDKTAGVKQKTSVGSIGRDEPIKNAFCKLCGSWKGELGLEPTIDLFISHLIQIFTEVKRVLRKDGTLFVNLGDSSAGSGSPGGDYKNKRKGDEYLRPYNRKELPAKCMLQIPNRFSIAMTDQLGFILRREIIWHKPSVMPMSYKDNYTLDYEKIFFFVKNQKYYFEQQFEPAEYDGRKDTKFKGSQKYNNTDITPGGSVNTFAKQGHERWQIKDGIPIRNMRSVWNIPSEPLKESHYATYPQKLVQRMIESGCPEGGVVLDPFIGSGTTGIVARKLNRNYIGIDLKYHEINENRMDKELGFFR